MKKLIRTLLGDSKQPHARVDCGFGHLVTKKIVFNAVFAALAILPATSNAQDVVGASVSAPNVTAAGGSSYSFTVSYTDGMGIRTNSIDSDDVRVTGPNGFDVAANLVHLDNPAVATYSITPPGGSWNPADNGTYSVVMQANQVFGNDGDSVVPGIIGSFTVNVSGLPPPTPTPSQPLNISTRMDVRTDDQVLIAGFIITGNSPKKVILRAIGPSLDGAGIPNPLADPVLELHGGDGSMITSNDNWKESQQSEIEATGIPPQRDAESAIVATLTPGNYTAVMKGKNATTGVGLVEGFDLDQAADSLLANISTRGFVETGSNVMIGGFILGGATGNANVLIRALGPSLTPLGVASALADPTLELHDADGALVQSNDNWEETQQSEILATGLQPQNDLESAIFATLAPGAYTAIVAGSNGSAGVALVEVYRLP